MKTEKAPSIALPESAAGQLTAAGIWRLPSGRALAEHALRGGFLAPWLWRTARGQDQALRAWFGPAVEGRKRRLSERTGSN